MSATLTYNGATLTETVTDTVTHATYTHSYAANIPAAIGANTGFVGFGGGTGAALEDVYLHTWTYTVGTGQGASVAMPAFSPPGGTYRSAQSVTISDATSGATIYYTTNGTTPSTSSTRYTAPIKVRATKTLKAIAVAMGGTHGAVASAAYTMTSQPSVVMPTFSPAAGSYSSAQSVTISHDTSDATIYYTTDGTTPTSSSTRYTAPIPISATETLEAIAVATGDTNSAVASADYTISSRPSVSREAYVYNTVAAGTYVYVASSYGKLSLVKGSPFQTEGQVVGSNGKLFVTQGSGYVFAYTVEANGGIGKLISKIDTQHYSGSECGDGRQDAELDHAGAYVYVLLGGKYSGDKKACSALQTFEIGKTGELTFKGSTNAGDEDTVLPAMTDNKKFAYSISSNEKGGGDCCYFTSFSRESTGVLNVINAHEADPGPKPGTAVYTPISNPTPDSTDHFALTIEPRSGGPRQLASYTVDSQGNTTSTNTWENMPTVPDDIYGMLLDPTGKILAIATDDGVQFFHFNGAAPITKFTGIIETSGHISEMAWDNDGHLYAQNAAGGKMHVYAVTTTSATELSGSPTVIPQGAFVVRTK